MTGDRYGPRPSDRKLGFSGRGRLHCEIGYTSVAQKARGKQAQVCGGSSMPDPCHPLLLALNDLH
jgi:hypothetical protein